MGGGILAAIRGGIGIAMANAEDDAIELSKSRRYLAGGIFLLALCTAWGAYAFAKYLAGIVLG